jgi:hypothetical protein
MALPRRCAASLGLADIDRGLPRIASARTPIHKATNSLTGRVADAYFFDVQMKRTVKRQVTTGLGLFLFIFLLGPISILVAVRDEKSGDKSPHSKNMNQ